jgi:hypothetical protein
VELSGQRGVEFTAFSERKIIMKIAQIAPLMESVPPRLYGGTERIVSHLTEELVALGHDVTLFASGDSITAATLAPCDPRALRLDADVRDPIPYRRRNAARALAQRRSGAGLDRWAGRSRR